MGPFSSSYETPIGKHGPKNYLRIKTILRYDSKNRGNQRVVEAMEITLSLLEFV